MKHLVRYLVIALVIGVLLYGAWSFVIYEPNLAKWPVNVRLSALFTWLAVYLFAAAADWFYSPVDTDDYDVID